MNNEIIEIAFELRSKTKVKNKPDYTFTGGITVKTKDDKEYILDFTETRQQEYTKSKGHCIVTVTQRFLDHDYIKDSNETLSLEDMLSLQFLKDNAKSIAIYFEAEAKNEEAYESEFELVSCNFRTSIWEENPTEFSSITTLDQ